MGVLKDVSVGVVGEAARAANVLRPFCRAYDSPCACVNV